MCIFVASCSRGRSPCANRQTLISSMQLGWTPAGSAGWVPAGSVGLRSMRTSILHSVSLLGWYSALMNSLMATESGSVIWSVMASSCCKFAKCSSASAAAAILLRHSTCHFGRVGQLGLTCDSLKWEQNFSSLSQFSVWLAVYSHFERWLPLSVASQWVSEWPTQWTQ